LKYPARDKEACNSIGTALLHSIAEIGAQSTKVSRASRNEKHDKNEGSTTKVPKYPYSAPNFPFSLY
jgi:hypothetical protein